VSPAIRVAGLLARGPARERIRPTAWWTSCMSARAAAGRLEIVHAPGRAGHLQRRRSHLRQRRDALGELVRRHLGPAVGFTPPSGGLALWLSLPAGLDAPTVAERCAARGVMVSPGDEWFPTEPSGPHLRLHFAGPHPARFAEGLAVLAEVLAGAGAA